VEVEFTKERAGKQNSKIIYKLSNSVPFIVPRPKIYVI